MVASVIASLPQRSENMELATVGDKRWWSFQDGGHNGHLFLLCSETTKHEHYILSTVYASAKSFNGAHEFNMGFPGGISGRTPANAGAL